MAAAAVAVWAAAARGNGGTAEYWLEGGVAGSLRPKQETAIRLVSETLKITIERQPTLEQLTAAAAKRTGGPSDGYRVEARYALENPGPPARALYAVPIVVTRAPAEHPGDLEQGYTVGLSGEELARRVRVSVGGEARPCAYVRRPAVPGAAVPADLRPIGISLARGEPLVLDGFCAVTLELPHGPSELTLTYSAELFGSEVLGASKECEAAMELDCEGAEHETAAEKKACRARRAQAFRELEDCPPRRRWSDVWLYYPLGAASAWAGTPDFVRVEVALGGFELDREGSQGIPAGAVAEGGVLRWTWERPALAGKDFRVALRKRGAVRGRVPADTVSWCVPREVRARASSSIPGQGQNGYGAAQAVDDRAATAWCVNTPAGGVGEWIEVTFPVDPAHAWAAGLFLVPGYAKSEKAWQGNGRVARIRYGACGSGGALREAKLAVPEDSAAAVVAVEGSAAVLGEALYGLREAKGGELCVRVEIAAAVPGARSKDVCISELRVPLVCE